MVLSSRDALCTILKRNLIFIFFTNTMDFLTDLWKFLKERKKWWLLPMIVVLLLIGTLIVLAGGSAIAPFIYTLF
jgi:hypothetical protein